ncbi:MAG: Glu-tRNA(Gln) amidotransferase subunit GatD [Candidatus Woesearchaeota archaeon]
MKHVKIHLDKEHLEGILVNEDDKHLVLKLSSGYNIGIKKSAVVKIEDISSHKDLVKEQTSEKIHEKIVHNSDVNSNLPKVLILHTGGTIASKVDYKTGAVTPKFSPQELQTMFPELKELAHIESKLFRNMASDDMRFSHYNLIAKEVELELEKNKDLKGVIVTQGTDTIHYTTAALGFIFEHLPIPVLIVGSQRSSDRGSSDAAMNLISAVAFIANTSLKGVFICMHESMNDDSCIILNGFNAKKMHSSRRDAFKSINVPPIARVDYATKSIEYLSTYPDSVLNSQGKLSLKLFNENLRIGIIVSHPNMYAKEITPFLDDFDGVILEGTGLCHFPINEIDEYTSEHTKIKSELTKLANKIPVVMSLQTVAGSVNMNVYRPGTYLIEMGIIGNYSSLITETAFIKLSWLLSQKLDPKEYFMKDLRGEFSNTNI